MIGWFNKLSQKDDDAAGALFDVEEILLTWRAKLEREGELAIRGYGTGVGHIAGLVRQRFGFSDFHSVFTLSGIEGNALLQLSSDLEDAILRHNKAGPRIAPTMEELRIQLTFGSIVFSQLARMKRMSLYGPSDKQEQARDLFARLSNMARALAETSAEVITAREALESDW